MRCWQHPDTSFCFAYQEDHMKYSVTALKEKVRKIFMQIEEIEKEVHSRLSKIDIEIIKKKEINEFIG